MEFQDKPIWRDEKLQDPSQEETRILVHTISSLKKQIAKCVVWENGKRYKGLYVCTFQGADLWCLESAGTLIKPRHGVARAESIDIFMKARRRQAEHHRTRSRRVRLFRRLRWRFLA